MSGPAEAPGSDQVEELFRRWLHDSHVRTDRVFLWLNLAQWAFAVLVALVWSPYAWAGKAQTTHFHVWLSLGLGGVLVSFPVWLVLSRPGRPETRFTIAVVQMLWSALLIHLSGGRIETHFHVFGSLAFLAFYKDWKVLVPATVMVVGDHLIRGLVWPESVYGITNPEWWRFLEHAGWVLFEDVILVVGCRNAMSDLRLLAERQVEADRLSRIEREKTVALEAALASLKEGQEALARSERRSATARLAAMGTLAASVAHELRNPLTTIQTTLGLIRKKTGEMEGVGPFLERFIAMSDREIDVCTRIISDLLAFAQERAPDRAPCPLRPLVDEAFGLVPPGGAQLMNLIPEDLPAPNLDRDLFRQVLINLVQNAVEAFEPGARGQVAVEASGGNGKGWTVIVRDDGPGIAPEVAERVFEPLFTTKKKGTGLGLPIVQSAVWRHGGTIRVESAVGRGTCFVVELPLAG